MFSGFASWEIICSLNPNFLAGWFISADAGWIAGGEIDLDLISAHLLCLVEGLVGLFHEKLLTLARLGKDAGNPQAHRNIGGNP